MAVVPDPSADAPLLPPKHPPARISWLIAAAFAIPPALFTLWLSGFLGVVAAGDTPEWSWAWLPHLDVSLAFRLDGLSLLFALLVAGIGAGILLYAAHYMEGHPGRIRFLAFLTAFMISMLGLVVADDIITLFVFWELTTITSFLLIGFNHEEEKSRRNALQALLVTGIGGLALLAGLILLATMAETWRISEIIAVGSDLHDHPYFTGALILILLGAFTKSAQFPFHFWLPNAMAAPTPVSAYLHSATMVKAGVFLLARLHPAFAESDIWLWTLTAAGATTAVWASIWALRQEDLKQTLACTTLMALGVLVLLLAADTPVAVTAAMTFLLVHALYKAGLFLIIGIIDHETGTRSRLVLSGLGGAMPITFTIAVIAGLSMAGFPPFLGFIGKELKYEGALAVASEPLLVIGALVLANGLMVAVAGMLVFKPFLGPKGNTPKPPHDPGLGLWLTPAVLAACGLLWGLAPGLISDVVVIPAAEAVLAKEANLYLKLWHGINIPLMLSIITVALGVGIFFTRERWIAKLIAFQERMGFSGDSVYDRCLAGTLDFAAWAARIQTGLLRDYLRMTVVASLASVLLGVLWFYRGPWVSDTLTFPPLVGLALAGCIVVGTVAAVLARNRIAGLCALGTVGAGIAGIFVIHGALDVAMTQLLVDVLAVVLAAAVVRRLPKFRDDLVRSKKQAWVDGSIAVTAGVAISAALIAVLAHPFDRRITDFFEATSVPDAYGRNIVNVILVDFRALDTLGEVAVVAIAALGVWILVKAYRSDTTPTWFPPNVEMPLNDIPPTASTASAAQVAPVPEAPAAATTAGPSGGPSQ